MVTTNGKTGAALIVAERVRQICEEGWTPEHDAGHMPDDLARAATCYAMPSRMRQEILTREYTADTLDKDWPISIWNWGEECWKPTPDDRVRELVKAGALIAAEIDRISATVHKER